MEDKWDIESQLFLAVPEAEERDYVVYDWFRCILRSDEVESYRRKNQSEPPGGADRITVRTGDQIGELFLESKTVLPDTGENLMTSYPPNHHQ